MKRNTKQIIIESAIKRFNSEGFGKVSMYEIAKDLGLSRGNLAYHFKDKDTLLTAITAQMWKKLEERREKTLSFPSFKNITLEFHKLYEIQKAYSFIFLDTHVLKHPLIKTQFREMIAKYIQDNKTIIAFAVKMENMKPEAIPGTYNQLALVTWMISFFWLGQQVIRDDFSEKLADKALWSQIIPHLTEKGKNSLTKSLGEEFIAELGEPFDLSMENIIMI